MPAQRLAAHRPDETRQTVVCRDPRSNDALLARALGFRDGRLIRLGESVANSDIINFKLPPPVARFLKSAIGIGFILDYKPCQGVGKDPVSAKGD